MIIVSPYRSDRSKACGRTGKQSQFVNGLDAEDEELLEEWCGLQGEAVDLDEWE